MDDLLEGFLGVRNVICLPKIFAQKRAGPLLIPSREIEVNGKNKVFISTQGQVLPGISIDKRPSALFLKNQQPQECVRGHEVGSDEEGLDDKSIDDQ